MAAAPAAGPRRGRAGGGVGRRWWAFEARADLGKRSFRRVGRTRGQRQAPSNPLQRTPVSGCSSEPLLGLLGAPGGTWTSASRGWRSVETRLEEAESVVRLLERDAPLQAFPCGTKTTSPGLGTAASSTDGTGQPCERAPAVQDSTRLLGGRGNVKPHLLPAP